MYRACVLCHQYSSAAVLLCTRPPSCVSRFMVSTTVDTLAVSPPVTNDNCLTGRHHRHYMRPRPICLECPGTVSIPWRQVMAATQPPPRDVSFIADIDDVIAPSQMSCCSKSQMVLATQPHLKMFILKRPRYHGRVHLSWCISDVSSIADVDDIVSPWKGSSSGGRQTPHDDSSIADVDDAIAPSQMSWKGTSPGQSQMMLSTQPHPPPPTVPDAMEGHVAYVSNITQCIGSTLPYPYPHDVILLTRIGTGTEFYILCRST